MSDKILQIHKRLNIKFSRGEDVYLYDINNNKYLDFGSGIAVNIFGHCHPKLVNILQDQAAKLWHISNLYEIKELEDFAENITANSFADYAFLCNSGSEAVECGIKMIRNFFHHHNQPYKKEIITFNGAFHGRTIATISAAGNPKYSTGFEPLLSGFVSAEFNNIESVKKLISKNSAAILIEPIQGESGIKVANKKFMQQLRQIADDNDLLIFLDEVQCGFARTGYLYAYEYYGIKPDILASAKGLGGGFPVGACLSTKRIGDAMSYGSHGTTFGGNPLATRIANTILNEILTDGFLQKVQKKGKDLKDKLLKLQQEFPNIIEEVRGLGLMLGIKINQNFNNLELVQKLKDNYLLTIPAGDNVIRILPPLTIEEKHIDEFYSILSKILISYQIPFKN